MIAQRPGGLAFIGDWFNCRSGSIALIFALALPIVLTSAAAAIDYAMAIRQKSRLQAVVDAAALAAARELSLSNSRTDNVDSIVKMLVDNYTEASRQDAGHPRPSVQTAVSTAPLRVAVDATQSFVSVFGDGFGLTAQTLKAHAVAQIIGRPNICVLVLHAATNGALSLEQNARVTGENCGVYSNSTHSVGIKTKNSARLTATSICSGGGVQGGGRNFTPAPFLDCPAFDDPLAGRPEPTPAPCNSALPTTVTTARTLWPGTYCGGLAISNGAEVRLMPGIYIMKDGPLVVGGGAALTGTGVGIFLTGTKAHLSLEAASTISLEAPTDGKMAGLLVFAARQSTQGHQHSILSEDAHVMVGTIYLPTGSLRVDGAADVGSKSAYTAIVAETVRLFGGPHVVLNTRYDETPVPVPDGIKGAGQPVQLVE